jgi:acetyltransferase-like isoleucine patch superfamily enzyme
VSFIKVELAGSMRKLGISISDLSALEPVHCIEFEAPVVMQDVTSVRRYVRKIGGYTFFRGGSLQSLASIGRYCSVAPGLFIGGGNHPVDWLSTHPFQYAGQEFGFWADAKSCETDLRMNMDILKPEPVIGNDVWIGANVTINRGVVIGDGAIVASGSVVAKSVAPYMIVGGCPAKVIRPRFDTDVIAELLRIKWWDLPHSSLSGLPFDDVLNCIEELNKRFPAADDRPSRSSRKVVLQNFEIISA